VADDRGAVEEEACWVSKVAVGLLGPPSSQKFGYPRWRRGPPTRV